MPMGLWELTDNVVEKMYSLYSDSDKVSYFEFICKWWW